MMKESNWTIEQIPDLTGRVVVVTGATSGLGAEAADVLAGKNATSCNGGKGYGKRRESRYQY